MGETSMPVRMRGDEVRFDQQNPTDWDFKEKWPSRIESEGGDMIGSFPIKQGESGVLAKKIMMNLKSTEKKALLIELMKDFEI
jgi:hypothetical protein